MFFEESSADRSEAYSLLAGLFSQPPGDDNLEAIKRELELKSAETALKIMEDFNSVLSYPGGRLPPLESLFAEAGDVDAAESVSGFYVRAGLIIGEEFDVPPDHLSLELLFMSYLVKADDSGLIENFLDEHIMNWVPYYCEELKRQAATLFYREIADITGNFLQAEYGGSE